MYFLYGLILGLIFGVLLHNITKLIKPEGVMEFDDSDSERDRFNLIVLVPFSKFKSKKLVTFKTKRVKFEPFNEE